MSEAGGQDHTDTSQETVGFSPPHTYLERRMQHLLSLVEAGRLRLVEDALGRDQVDELLRELRKVRRKDDGRIDLTTCSPTVRSLARFLYSVAKTSETRDSNSHETHQESHEDLDPNALQRTIFELFESMAKELCGERPDQFGSVDEFHEAAKRRVLSQEVDRHQIEALTAELRETYGRYSRAAYTSAKRMGGMKLVVGGNQRFPNAAFDAVRSMLLYADTILVPDPVLPWLEVQRNEEKFANILLFREMYSVLRLKPLVDAELPYPALLLFPSWEKSLELADEETQDALSCLFLSFFSHHLGTTFEDESEILGFATRYEEEFLAAVNDQQLFIAPGGRIGDSLDQAIDAYRESITQYRSEAHKRSLLGQPPGCLIVNGIMERIVPQLHLRENADTLGAAPMLWADTHWHYFSLCSVIHELQLVEANSVSKSSLSVIRALNDRKFEWLGNVPMAALVDLRQRNANEEFRRKLNEFTDALVEAEIGDLDRALGEVGRGLASLLADHKNTIRDIEENYKRKHTGTAVSLGITAAAQFLPWLTPFLPVLPALPTTKYVLDKVEEVQKKRAASRTLTGVLAAAHVKD